VSKLSSFFSRFFAAQQSSLTSRHVSKQMEFPTELLRKDDVFQYLDFNIPELQPIKLSLEFHKQDKAFEQFFQYLKIRNSPAFPCNWWKRNEIIETLNSHYPTLALELLDAANKIVEHKLLLFSSHPIQADTPIRWNRDYEEGAAFDADHWKPGSRYTMSQLLSDPQNDIYFVWELNRHQHFLDLGKAYWYSGDETFAEEFVRQIKTWIDQNPYPDSVNWVSPNEIALRGVFWLLGYNFFLRSEWVDEDFFCHFYRTLLYHGHAVYNALQATSQSSSPPVSHLVAQAAFLYLLGTLFPEYIHSKQWSVFGWDILQGKTPLLSLDALTQQVVVPLAHTSELYCIILLMRQHNRYHIPHAVSKCLTKMLDRLLPFLKPEGCLCRFGQEHPRQLLTGMYGAARGNVRYLFSMAALMFHNSTLAAVGKEFDPLLLWFFGNEGLKDFANFSPTAPGQQSCLLSNSSYAVMRSGWDEKSSYCLMAANSCQDSRSSGLRHSDLLSFELVAHGQEYIIDSGPYSLQRDEAWNRYFSSVQAHNSITVDRGSHFAFENDDVECLFDLWVSTSNFDLVSGYHTGFEDLDDPITHRRTIFYYKPGYWIVCDLLTGEGQHFFDQSFHFPPFRLNIDFTNKCVNVQLGEQRHFTLMPFMPREMEVSISTGGETPDSGWLSDGYKTRIGAPFIQYGKQTLAPTTFHTLLYSYSNETPLNFSSRQLQALIHETSLLGHEISAFEISHERETHYFVLLHEPKTEDIQIEELTLNGTLCFVRWEDETLREVILYNAALLMIQEKIIFRAEAPVEHITLQFHDDALLITCLGNYTFQMQCSELTDVIVNKRKAFVRRDGEMIVVSTSRI